MESGWWSHPICRICQIPSGVLEKVTWARVYPEGKAKILKGTNILLQKAKKKAVNTSRQDKLNCSVSDYSSSLLLQGGMDRFLFECLQVWFYCLCWLLLMVLWLRVCFWFLEVQIPWKFTCRSSLRPRVEALFFQRGFAFASGKHLGIPWPKYCTHSLDLWVLGPSK